MKAERPEDYNAFWKSWATKNALNYYSSHRSTVSDVYESEKFFISRVLRPEMEILDVGCAAGGFSNIFHQMEPTVRYTGVDVSKPLIEKGTKRHPGSVFLLAEGAHLPFRENSFDLVFCSGVLHMTLNWREMMKECWRVSRNALIFDVRLIENGDSVEDARKSYQRVSFQDEWDGTSLVPYIILNLADFLPEIRSLCPSPKSIGSYGYFNTVSETAVTPYSEVCMSVWCLGKEEIGEDREIWMLPIHPRTGEHVI